MPCAAKSGVGKSEVTRCSKENFGSLFTSLSFILGCCAKRHNR